MSCSSSTDWSVTGFASHPADGIIKAPVAQVMAAFLCTPTCLLLDSTQKPGCVNKGAGLLSVPLLVLMPDAGCVFPGRPHPCRLGTCTT
jgi:hypothetical protein